MPKVGLIAGDGIGPEISDAAVQVLEAAQSDLEFERIDLGHRAAALNPVADPLPDQALDRLRSLGTVLKGPLEAPKQSGPIVKARGRGHVAYASINNALRRELQLFANVRPIRSIPGISPPSRHLDLIMVREVSEGIYSGLEHHIGECGAEAIKVVTRSASERIMRYAFELAEEHDHELVLVGHKANVLHLTDGLFLDAARAVSVDYPTVGLDDLMVDALGLELARGQLPRAVVVLDNQYGDILSDVAAGVVGSVGLVPGANYGPEIALFEACHGSAPDIAGTGTANPVGLILSGALMLRHLGYATEASYVEHAVIDALQDPAYRTPDLGGSATTQQVGAAVAQGVRFRSDQTM